MLTAVKVTNAVGDELMLSVLNPDNGYPIREITGLDPVNASLTTSSLAQVDGAQFQNARREMRNIVIKLGLEPDFVTATVASLRSGLYQYLMPKMNVTLSFYLDDVLTYQIAGQVENLENSMFSADPEVDISILCYDPDFYAPAPISISSNTVDGTIETPVEYDGTSECGLIFQITLSHDLDSGFAIYNTPPGFNYQGLSVDAALLADDIITVNTIPGQKSITLFRDAIESSLLYGLQMGGIWLSLTRGTNYFRAYTEGDPIPYDLTYTAKYGGI